MTKQSKTLLGTALVAGGIFLSYKCWEKHKPSAAEVKDTKGMASISLSLPGLAMAGIGAYLIFKKD